MKLMNHVHAKRMFPFATTSLNKKKVKKLISEIHILPEIIYNENRRNEAKGIQKIS